MAAITWCVTFALPHVAWAFGSRWGLAQESIAADAAFENPWFVAYNAATIVLCLVGAGAAIAQLTGRAQLLPRFQRVATVLAYLLGIRGVIGLVGLLIAGTEVMRTTPPLLLLVELWFLAGALILWTLASTSRVVVDLDVGHN